ncbi:hypothetical protein, partial [Nostoc sp. ChiSLP03a]|uniref:hypothetical protein n=1 Tax=Nostoc sp. ChiSLP03a TaxID=3075380 RepID=UPI002AD536E1
EDTVCRRFFSSSSLSAIAILNGRLMVLLTYLVCFSPLYADSFLIGIKAIWYKQQIHRNHVEVPESRFEVPKSRFEVPKSRFEVPESRFEVLKSRFEVPESRFEVLKSRFEVPEGRFEVLKSRFEVLKSLSHRDRSV